MGKTVRVIGTNTTEAWEAPDGSRWLLLMTWAEVEGRAECVGLELRSFAALGDDPGGAVNQGDEVRPVQGSSSVRPLRGEVLRRLPMAEVELKRRQWAELLADDGPLSGHADNDRRRSDHAAFVSTGRGRTLVGPDGAPLPADEALEEVARVYLEAWQVGEPTLAVAEAFSLSRSAAAKRVARARERGFLPKTTRGRAAGGRRQTGAN